MAAAFISRDPGPKAGLSGGAGWILKALLLLSVNYAVSGSMCGVRYHPATGDSDSAETDSQIKYIRRDSYIFIYRIPTRY